MLGNRVVRALAVCLLSASTAAAQSYFYGPTQQSSGGGGSNFISSLGAVGSSPNDNACSVDGSGVFQMQPASSTKPGVITTGAQTIAGAKTWSGAAAFSSSVTATGAVAGSNLSGTNTGDHAGGAVFSTSGAPSNGAGIDGDFAFDAAAAIMYGPKASGVWPAGASLAKKYTRRWIEPPRGAVSSDALQAVSAAGRIYGRWLEVPEPCSVIGIGYIGASSSGNARGAIYGPVTSVTMAGAALIAESASAAVAVGGQVLATSATTISAGWYYVAIAFSSTSASYYRVINQPPYEPGMSQVLTTDQAFGAFPATAGPMTNNTTGNPVLGLQCQ